MVALLGMILAGCVTAPPATPPGPDFLTRNARAAKVVTLPSGVQYFIVQRDPRGGAQPVVGDRVRFHYEGRLTDGTIFDSSLERGMPLEGEVGRFVKGFNEALTRMRPGDQWLVWIPPHLAYGERARGKIPANSVLRFDLRLLKVTPQR